VVVVGTRTVITERVRLPFCLPPQVVAVRPLAGSEQGPRTLVNVLQFDALSVPKTTYIRAG
jgi:hypothetical protein